MLATIIENIALRNSSGEMQYNWKCLHHNRNNYLMKGLKKICPIYRPKEQKSLSFKLNKGAIARKSSDQKLKTLPATTVRELSRT
jgi:thiamine biosynthesis protein ThiC